MSTRAHFTYNDYLAYWSKNDTKAEEYIKNSMDNMVQSFYNELRIYAQGELPKEITASTKYPMDDNTWVYPKHTPAVRTMCKEVEAFIQSKGFPYKLNYAGSGILNDTVCPIRCKFVLKN